MRWSLYRKSAVRPDIVIMDYRMPLMNGIDAMRVIMAMGGPVKFIFLSADASVRDEVTRMGAIFLKKPASLRELMQAIDSLPNVRRTGIKRGRCPGWRFFPAVGLPVTGAFRPAARLYPNIILIFF